MGKCLGLILLCAHGIWKGTNVLLAKGTVYTGMKGICEKFTMLTSGSSDVDHLKKLLKNMEDGHMNDSSKFRDAFLQLGRYCWAEKHWNRTTKCS